MACLTKATFLVGGIGTLNSFHTRIVTKMVGGVATVSSSGSYVFDLRQHARDNVPAVFGDVLAAVVAGIVLWIYRKQSTIPAKGVYFVNGVCRHD